MDRIDAHQHCWRYSPDTHAWITDDMQEIRRDFLPADLEPLLQRQGVAGCVAVQADQTEAENERLLQWAAAHPFIRGVVGWVDLQDPRVGERLRHYRQFSLMKGFRHILQGEPQRDLMLTPAFRRGIALLSQHGYTYDILVYADQWPYVEELVRAFPDQPFVLDHLGKPDIRSGGFGAWKAAMESLSQHPNLCAKLSGLVTEADWKHWTPDLLQPYLETALECFGPNRLMAGSDWPVCLVAGEYDRVWQLVADFAQSLSKAEADAILGGTATKFYNLHN